jgi:hypothetical protein
LRTGATCSLSREAGEGWGGGDSLTSPLDPSEDRLAYVVEMPINVLVRHPQYAIAISGEPGVSPLVVSDLLVV